MAFIDNRGYARVDSNPNSIAELQSGHQILMACHNVDNRIWKYVPGNPAGSKWEIVSPTHDYYREHFVGLANESDHNNDKSFSIESIDMAAKRTAAGFTSAFNQWVLGGDGYLYAIYYSGGAKIAKFDPNIDDFVETYDVSGQQGGIYRRGFYRPTDHKIYFTNDNGSLVIFDLEQKEVTVRLSGLATPTAGYRSGWLNVDATKLYLVSFRQDIVAIYDFDTDSYSTVTPGLPGGYGTTSIGLGKDNIAYIGRTTSNGIGASLSEIYKFDCNTDTIGAAIPLNGSGGTLQSVWSPDRRYIYIKTSYNNTTTPAEIIIYDTETDTDSIVLRTTIGVAANTNVTSYYGGVIGLDGKAIWMPSWVDGNADNFVTIETDGSNIAEGINETTLGLTSADRAFQSFTHALNGCVYSGILSQRMFKIRYHNKRHEALEVHRYADNLNY